MSSIYDLTTSITSIIKSTIEYHTVVGLKSLMQNMERQSGTHVEEAIFRKRTMQVQLDLLPFHQELIHARVQAFVVILLVLVFAAVIADVIEHEGPPNARTQSSWTALEKRQQTLSAIHY